MTAPIDPANITTSTAVEIEAAVELRPTTFDFGECPIPLNEGGCATWDRLFALQAHVAITRQRTLINELVAVAAQCDVCDGRPCPNPSFCRACKIADRLARRSR